MVKVVGKDESAVKRKTCFNCASVLEYTPSDVKERTVSDYTGSKDLVRYVICPNCNCNVSV
jgi:RNase P subunit RPR2